MNTLECQFADGTPGRLSEDGGVLTLQVLTDGSMKTKEDAGTLTVQQTPGGDPSPLIALAREAGFVLDIPGEVNPPAPPVPTPEPEAEPTQRRRPSS